MSVRFLPVLLLLSGCAVGEAIGTGIAAVGDGTKYVIKKIDGEPTSDAGTAPAGHSAPPAPEPAPATADSPTVRSAPTAPIEVEPLD
ncbi:MAG TPA: hypothetical protein VFO41_02445 [Alphaproteobacteria bacterium]|nr:hypothetical protein [Alphaproteobacteria bacterium]